MPIRTKHLLQLTSYYFTSVNLFYSLKFRKSSSFKNIQALWFIAAADGVNLRRHSSSKQERERSGIKKKEDSQEIHPFVSSGERIDLKMLLL